MSSFVAFAVERMDPIRRQGEIIAVSAVKIENGMTIQRFHELVNPGVPLTYKASNLTGITKDKLKCANKIAEVLERLWDFSKDGLLVGHDIDFIKKCPLFQDSIFVDIKYLAMQLIKRKLRNYSIANLASVLGIPRSRRFDVAEDAECIAEIYYKLKNLQGNNNGDE